jgi:hypothetical protein
MLDQLIRRSSLTWKEFNEEDNEAYFYNPSIELSWLEKNLNKLENEKSSAEFKDIQTAHERLVNYNKALNIMENASMIGSHLTVLNTRIAKSNFSNPMNLLRYSRNESIENILKELEILAQAYYQMIDDCEANEAWIKKLEDEVGQEIAFTFLQIDETSREALVQSSETFARFEGEKAKYFR